MNGRGTYHLQARYNNHFKFNRRGFNLIQKLRLIPRLEIVQTNIDNREPIKAENPVLYHVINDPFVYNFIFKIFNSRYLAVCLHTNFIG